ncbi:MAG: YiiD C-terminal domain-containing protein [Pseudomonadota bacterium]
MDANPAALEGAKRLLEQGIAFVRNAGLVVEHLERGEVRCLMPFKGNGNHIGTMYAGALFTLAEIPGGALFLSSFDTARFFPVVKALNLKFLKPAKGDVRVSATLAPEEISRIEQQAAESGKADFALSLELKDTAGVVVAVSEGLYQLRRL